MTAIGIKNMYAYSFVCSRHFRKEDFLYEGRLSDKTIPSVFVSVYFSLQNTFYFTVLHKVISKDDEKFETNELFSKVCNLCYFLLIKKNCYAIISLLYFLSIKKNNQSIILFFFHGPQN